MKPAVEFLSSFDRPDILITGMQLAAEYPEFAQDVLRHIGAWPVPFVDAFINREFVKVVRSEVH